MEKRIVRLEDELWRIRTDAGELPDSERKELEKYFGEVGLPFRIVDGRLCVSGDVDMNVVIERLEHFYEGRAQVFPF